MRPASPLIVATLVVVLFVALIAALLAHAATHPDAYNVERAASTSGESAIRAGIATWALV